MDPDRSPPREKWKFGPARSKPRKRVQRRGKPPTVFITLVLISLYVLFSKDVDIQKVFYLFGY